MTTTTHYLGTTADGEAVYVTIDLSTESGLGSLTVEHQPAPETYLLLSITGETRYGTSEAFGQIIPMLDEITTPSHGWTAADIASLKAVWQGWHLNDMRSACAHMPADAHQRWNRREPVVCEAGSGYTYGSSWLLAVLPPDVVDEVLRLMDLPATHRAEG